MGVPANRWHRYDRMQRFPANFCSVGDAVSSVNPIYGQGMTKAAIHAMHLRELLRDDLAPARIAERMRLDLPALAERHAWMTTVYGDLVLLFLSTR
jgi:flavin-dependent dehydrogenase